MIDPARPPDVLLADDLEGERQDRGDRRPRVRWPVVAAFGAWSVLVWATRIRNIWGDVLLSTEEKAALTVIALVFVVLGIGVFFVGVSLRRWFPQRSDIVAVGVLGGWTLGVWVSRVVDIAFGGDHEVPFIVVHVLLAVVSVGLGAWSWLVVADAKAQAPEARVSEGPSPGPAPEGPGSEGHTPPWSSPPPAVEPPTPPSGSVPVEGRR